MIRMTPLKNKKQDKELKKNSLLCELIQKSMS